jgi:hypothetical protein
MAINYGLFKYRFKKSIADAVYNEIVSKTARYYHFLGKQNNWTDFVSPFIPSSSSDVPGIPSENYRYELQVRRDILTTKLITPTDVSYVIPRINWQSNYIYDMYDDSLSTSFPAASGAVRIEQAKFYVLTDDYNVYKCLSNNNQVVSTVKPTGTSSSRFTTADGYIWKFMYTIPISLRNRFLSTQYMPVTTALTNQFYSNGEINQIEIVNRGSGYNTLTTVVVTGDGTLADDPYAITELVRTDSGFGYSSAPTLTISPPTVTTGTEIQATATATISGGSINQVTIVDRGFGYTRDPVSATPVVTVSPPITGAAAFTANTPYTLNTKVSFQGRFYNVDSAGTSGSTGPTHATGSAPNGGTTLTFVARQAVITPTLTPTAADLDLVISGGQITGVVVNDGGVGYTNANLQIVDPKILIFASGGGINTNSIVFSSVYYGNNGDTLTGTGIPANTTIVSGSGSNTLTLSNNLTAQASGVYTYGTGGSGGDLKYVYNIGNVNTLQANVELSAVKGTIEAMKVVSGGSGYGAATVTIIGDGVGAAATATVVNGVVTKINMTNVGRGYTWTDIIIKGNGTGAVVRAIMSPQNGHGFNAIEELNASSIVFYSSISKDINQGLTVTNDYRTAGLIKNITKFGSKIRFDGDAGSGCVLINGEFNVTKLEYDMLLLKQEPTSNLIFSSGGLINTNSIVFTASSNTGLNGATISGQGIPTGTTIVSGAGSNTLILSNNLTSQASGVYTISPINYKKYRIVEFNSNQILVSVFNNFPIYDYDNEEVTLVTTKKVVNQDGSISEPVTEDVIKVNSAVERTIDQFSGDFLFLSVRESFAPSESQIITVKTVLNV